MRFAALLGTAVIGLWPGFAAATDQANFTLRTTEDLYRVCSDGSDDPLYREAIALCQGFLLGAVSYHDAVTTRENLKRLICYPTSVTRNQGMQAFVEWAASHQNDQKFMNEPAVFGAVRGLARKWPCS